MCRGWVTRVGWVFVLIALAAAILTSAASHEPFEPRLVRLEAHKALPALPLEQESPEINALMLHYASDQALWMSAWLAVMQHGDLAREVLLAYGLSPQWQDVLVRYGADAVLPVSYFHHHDSATLRAQHWLGERYQQLSRWWSDEEMPAPAQWSAQQRGLMGIAFLDAEGHALLNQFVIDREGQVNWLQGERVVTGVGDFFTSGIRQLESQWRSGDGVRASDLGWAGVDLLVMASTVKVLRAGRAARAGRVGALEAQGARVGVAASTGRFAALPRMARVAAVAGTAYVVVRHPSLVSALGANLANWLGWPTWLGQWLLWCLVLLPVLIMARWLYRWLISPLLWLLLPVARLCVRTLAHAPRQRG